ncbi:hypothetical protein J6G99_07430 [bacterium]|nr:hypothetical protein [bacterium]
MTKILDCTLRDGGHENNWFFDDNFIQDYLKNLKNIDFCEIGYRNYFDRTNKGTFFYCTPQIVQKYKNTSAKFGVMTDTTRFLIDSFIGAENDCIDFIRIATHPDKINETLNIANNLYKKNYNIFIQLMEIPNLKTEHYKILEKWNNKKILQSLYIADSYSQAQPKDLKKYFERLKNIGFDKISFHSHNGKKLALENTLKAIELGAYSVDVTQNGLGGNLNASKLFKKLSINFGI